MRNSICEWQIKGQTPSKCSHLYIWSQWGWNVLFLFAASYALLLSQVSTFRLDSGFETPGKNFHIFFYWKSNLEILIIVIQVLTYSGEKSSLFQVPTWPRILHKIENDVRKLIGVNHLDTRSTIKQLGLDRAQFF